MKNIENKTKTLHGLNLVRHQDTHPIVTNEIEREWAHEKRNWFYVVSGKGDTYVCWGLCQSEKVAKKLIADIRKNPKSYGIV